MADREQGAADAAPLDPQVAAEAAQAAEPPRKPKPGWLRNIQTDTFHEVEDKLAVEAAYPGQFEEVSAPAKGSKKIGWPEEDTPAE